MLYTRKGDKGTTKTYGCDQRMSKSSAVAEALGALDEINSFLGVAKVYSTETPFAIADKKFADIIHEIQQNLFMIQAEVAGFPMAIPEEKVKNIEYITDTAEKELPPIKTFFISGGTHLGATFDVARTIARRAERRVVSVHEEGTVKLGAHTIPYLNRLSSVLYALARLSNHKSGIKEEPPAYK